MKQILDTIRSHFACITSISFVLVAAALAVSALMAQSQNAGPNEKKGKCEDWFKSLTEEQRTDISDAFTDALSKSLTETNLRTDLLNSDHCYKKPKDTMQTRLNNLISSRPGHKKVDFPKKDTVIIFYEEEISTDNPNPSVKGTDTYHNEHCLHIFNLPMPDHPNLQKKTFKENLRCCYEPW